MSSDTFKVKATTYNRLFFDEDYSRSSRLMNQSFWSAMDAFRKKYPDAEIQCVIILHLGEFWEEVEVINAPDNIQKEFDEIHHRCYYAVRLKLYPEFVGRNDILQELSKNVE